VNLERLSTVCFIGLTPNPPGSTRQRYPTTRQVSSSLCSPQRRLSPHFCAVFAGCATQHGRRFAAALLKQARTGAELCVRTEAPCSHRCQHSWRRFHSATSNLLSWLGCHRNQRKPSASICHWSLKTRGLPKFAFSSWLFFHSPWLWSFLSDPLISSGLGATLPRRERQNDVLRIHHHPLSKFVWAGFNYIVHLTLACWSPI